MPPGRAGSDELAIELRPFAEGDEPRVLELLAAAFGTWPGRLAGVSPQQFFRWKHLECPFGPSICLVAVAGGEVVGFFARMRWTLAAGDHRIPTTRGVDLAVDPAYRGRGVAMALMRAAGEHLPAEVSFTWSNPNSLSHRRVLASGQVEVGIQPRFTRLHVPLRLRPRSHRPEARHNAEVDAPTAGETLDDGVGSRTMGLISRDSQGRYVTARDLQFLRWRYARVGRYHGVRVGEHGGREGIAIFRVWPDGPFTTVNVSELLVEEGDWRTARRLLGMVRGALGADSVSCCFPSAIDAAHCGFLKASGGAVLTVMPLHDHAGPDPARRSSWSLSLGDLELV